MHDTASLQGTLWLEIGNLEFGVGLQLHLFDRNVQQKMIIQEHDLLSLFNGTDPL